MIRKCSSSTIAAACSASLTLGIAAPISIAITFAALFSTAPYARSFRIAKRRCRWGVDISKLSRNAFFLAASLGVLGGVIHTLVSSFAPDLAPSLAGILF